VSTATEASPTGELPAPSGTPLRRSSSAGSSDSRADEAAAVASAADMCFIFDTRRFIACAALDLQAYLREMTELQAFTR
jgi:hypothetical protein